MVCGMSNRRSHRDLYLILQIAFLTYLSSRDGSEATSVRLIHGSNSDEGTVQVFHSGSWGTICDDSFSNVDAAVICRMLGHQNRYAIAYSQAHFGQGSGSILVDDLNCRGTETDITQCTFGGSGNNWFHENCEHTEDAGVACLKPVFRLNGGRANEGLLEMHNNGTWMSVCGRNVQDIDVDLICRSLGYFSGGEKLPKGSYGPGSGSVVDAHLDCFRNSNMCAKRPSKTTSCPHTEDVIISCHHTEVRLVGGSVPSEGRVEVKHNGIWGGICDQSFGSHEASVICRSLQLDASSAQVLTGSTFGKNSGSTWISSLTCSGSEQSIQDCRNVTWSPNACSPDHSVGLSCAPTKLRLVDGATQYEGRLEIYHQGTWGSISDHMFGDKEAMLACRMLGFSKDDTTPEVFPRGYFDGTGPTYQLVDHINCTGSEIDLSQCIGGQWIKSRNQNGGVGLRCQTKNIRLVGGSHSLEGRVEVRINGEWSTICDDSWDDIDASTVCKALTEYPVDRTVVGTAYHKAFFGAGRGKVALSQVECNGTEKDLFHCKADKSGGINCDHSRDAGVSCAANSTVFLTGTGSPNTGTVNLNVGNGIKTLCDHSWEEKDAAAICRSIGYWSTSPTVYVDAWFGQGNGSTMDISPQCTGNEANIAFCKLGNEWDKKSCSHTDDAGVGCTTTPVGIHNIRIVDGDIPGKGRVEVRYNGKWGAFCSDNWSDANTAVVCKMLHYSPSNASSFTVSRGPNPILVGSLLCNGTERDVGLCRAHLDKQHCNGMAAAVDCTDGIAARIVDSNGPMSGRVQIYKDGSWGEICGAEMNDNTAKTLCSMMGYRDTHAVVTTPTGSSNQNHGLLKVNNLRCDNWEDHISQCSYTDDGTCRQIGAYVKCFNCTRTYTSDSGNLTSLNYPNNYPPNLDCLTVIKPSTNTTHKLVIESLNFHDSGDVLEIREGQHGKHLGTFSASGNLPILAGKEFWVRFSTNSNGTASGFKLNWNTLTLEDTITVNCGPSTWNTAVNMTLLRELYPDSGVSQIYLSDQSCLGTVIDDTVYFGQPYSDCSTTKMTNNISVVHSNQLVYPDSAIPFPVIVHHYRWRVDLQCDLSRVDQVTHHYQPTDATTNTPVYHHIGGSGHYSLTLKFYKDPAFFQEIQGNPIKASIGGDVYAKVLLNTNDPGIKMRLHTCVTKPTPNADQRLTYTLIQDGCPVDPDTNILSQGTHETRFMFNAFEFPANNSDVYLTCNATFCSTSDASSTCTQTCHHKRNFNVVSPKMFRQNLPDSNENKDIQIYYINE